MATDKQQVAARYEQLKEVPLSQLATHYANVKRTLELYKEQVAAQMLPAETEMEALEAAFLNALQTSGQKSANFEGVGTVSLVPSTYYSIGDADQLAAYCNANAAFNTIDFFSSKLKKTSIESWVEKYGHLPPGVKKVDEVKAKFTAPRATATSATSA